MKWIVDRIEGNIVILENERTKEKLEIEQEKLPDSIHDGSVLLQSDQQFILDLNSEEEKRKKIEEKFQKLKNNR